MKTAKILTSIIPIYLLVVSFNLQAQNKEMPITTKSKEALQLFISGRETIENFSPYQAATLFDQAIEKDSEFAMAYLYRSLCGGGYNVYKKNLDNAISLADKVSEGERLQILYEQAGSIGDDQKRIMYLNKLLAFLPSDKRVQATAGIYYYGLNDYKKALDYFSKSTEIDAKFGPGYNMIGYCNAAMKNYAEAEKAFKIYISLIPDSPNGYDSYAELLLKMGKLDESISEYKKSLEKNPQFLSALLGLANNYVFKGDYETARKYYNDYFNYSQNINGRLTAIAWKAISYVHEGNYQKAINTYDEYRAQAEKENLPGSVINSYFLQGWLYSKNGNVAEGKKFCDMATELIDKSNISDTQKENLKTNSYFWQLNFLLENNELEKAAMQSEKCKQRIEERKTTSIEPKLNTLNGILAFKKGDFAKAIQHLTNAEKTNDPLVWYYLGLAYNKNGDKNTSLKYFEKIKNCYENSLNLAYVRQLALNELK